MPIQILNYKEREKLKELYFYSHAMGKKYPEAKKEIMTAIRCLKAIQSNAIEDKSIDRVFLQILLHDAGISDKRKISKSYEKAYLELQGQQVMLKTLEIKASQKEELSLSLILEMHRLSFHESWIEGAGKFRQNDVQIFKMNHQPPHPSKIQTLIYQKLLDINEKIKSIEKVTPETFEDIFKISAEVHYLIAGVHPFEDGNGRIARALGDYILLRYGMYYDVIMSEYRDSYLNSLEECDFSDITPLYRFLEFSYLETLQRISTFYKLASQNDTI